MNPHGGLPPLGARCKRPALSTINIIESVMKATNYGSMPVSIPEKRVVSRLLGALPSIDHLTWSIPPRHQYSTKLEGPLTWGTYVSPEARDIGKKKWSEVLEQFGVPFSTLTRDLSLLRDASIWNLYWFWMPLWQTSLITSVGQYHRRVAVSSLRTTSPPCRELMAVTFDLHWPCWLWV